MTPQRLSETGICLGWLLAGLAIALALAIASSERVKSADMSVREIAELLFKAPAKSRVSLAGRDLSFLDLSELDFKGANLVGSNLHGSDLTGAIIADANFDGANLEATQGLGKAAGIGTARNLNWRD